ncbi:MAG: glycosyltransferase [Deltaproteobacteria bacterium]|nr:glycosyltransferase [Deltaproteobacteria bacterium]MBW2298880.1 glycosyltransferase [Deltaproteobacteria bacterium]
MELCWASDFWEAGNAFGYSVHNRMMREHVAKFARLSGDAPVALTIAAADKYQPVPRKKNFLFTMFETEHLPASYVRRLPLADHLIVPNKHLVSVFRKYTDLPISVCHEGCNVGVFTYTKRKEPSIRPFRYLWVGAPNPRKGYVSLLEAWKAFAGDLSVELYIKTTSPKGLPHRHWAAKILERAREKPVRFDNIVFDARKLPLEGLVKLYHDAHAFVLPSTGEGWGLTLTEAMATGLPCIATRYAGTAMFFDRKVGYPIRHEMKPYYVQAYDLATDIAVPDTWHLVELMMRVKNDYRTALQKGKAAARRIRENFTWETAARRLVEIIKENGNGRR